MMHENDVKKAYAKLTVLQEAYKNCTKCDLSESRTQTVFGMGAVGNILVLAEAPGDVEDKVGYPLVGQSGQILDYLLAKTSNNPDLVKLTKSFPIKKMDSFNWVWKDFQEAKELLMQEVFYTNVVLCKPPNKRNPVNKEVKACLDRLLETIYHVDPIIIIAAGKLPIEVLLGKKIASIQKFSGRLIDITIAGKVMDISYSIMPLTNPVFLAGSPDVGKKDGLWENSLRSIKAVRDLIEEYKGMT